jgi:hypothetical protein
MKVTLRMKEMSLSELDSKFRNQIRKILQPQETFDAPMIAQASPHYYVRDIRLASRTAIVENGEELFSVSFELDEEGNVSSIGTLVPVQMVPVPKV